MTNTILIELPSFAKIREKGTVISHAIKIFF